MDRKCSECGETNWKELLQDNYPERRRERDRTVKTVYKCMQCGSFGRHFRHRHEGTEVFSGAFR